MPNPFKNREIDWAVEQYRRPEKNSRNQSGKNGRADTSPAFTARGIQAEREERIAQEEYKRYKRESPLGTGREAAEKAAREEYERFTNDEPLGTGWWTSRGVPKDQAEYLVQQKYVKEKTREYMDMHYPQRYAEKLAEQAYKKAKKEYDKGMGQRWQNMVAAEKEADRQRHISDIQNRTYEDPAPGVSIEMLDAARKTATDVEESLLLTQMYNGKVLSHYAEIFANTQMDGTDHSVLDEIKLLAIMDGGKEKRERKEAVLQKMDELGMKDGLNELFYPHFAGDGSFDLKTFGKWLRSSAEAGASGFFKSIADTADVTLGSALTGVGWEDNPVSKWSEYAGDNYASWKYNSNLYAEKLGGGGWDFGGETVEAAVGALPQFALALMTKGASLAASEGSLATTAAYETGGALTKVGLTTEAMMKNPQFWASFSRTLGSDYKAAKEMGVSDEVAAMGSVVTSLLNAGIEIGPDGKSGIQGLPYQTSDVWTLEGVTQGLESVFQEGGEEGLQKFVNEIVAKYLYGSEEPILVPEEYMWDMGVGAASGALLGGGKTATEMAVDAISGKKLGNGWHNAGNYASQEGLSVMESLNEAGLYGSESLAQSSPGAYSLYIQEAKDKGVSTDQALKYATAATAMEIGTRNMPIDVLLDSMDGDPKTAAQVMDDMLKQSGIEMTPMELNWLGDVAAKVSALQQDPAFATEIALEMLSGKSGEEAKAAASKALWQDVLNREITSKKSEFGFSPDAGQEQPAGVIDTEVIPKYNEENGQEAGDYGSGETNQDILRRENSMGDSGGRSENTGTLREDDSILLGEGIPEGGSGGTVSVSDSGGITDYDDDFDHFDGRARVDAEGKSIPAESVNCLRGTTVVDDSGAPIAVYHGTTEMDFTTFEKGDTGFHFGTYEQATNHIKDKEAGPRRIIRAYLNIQKPLYTDTDIGQWNALPLAMYLYTMQVLTDAEYADVHNLWQTNAGYDSPAAVRLREILTAKGYDGVVYPNYIEGKGDSYMVFRDDQIIRSEVTNFGLEGEKGHSTLPQNSPYAPDIVIGKSLSAKAKNYQVYDPKSGEYFTFVEGSRIRNPKIFAGKGGVKPLRPEVIEGLTREYPTDKPSNWQHCKGIATLNFYGEERVAEVHWFQEETAGKHKFKIKKWIE